MTKNEFAEHFSGVLAACADPYITANLQDALNRYVAGNPKPEPPGRSNYVPPHSPSGWPGTDQ